MQDRAVIGDWNLTCDSCGRKIKASTARKRWDGFWVCPEDWESRHMLDWYHTKKDLISVPWTRDQQRSGTETFDDLSPASPIDTTGGDPDTTGTFDNDLIDSTVVYFAADFVPNTNILRGADLTGNADGKQGTLVAWVNPDESGNFYVIGSAGFFFRFNREGNGTMLIRGEPVGGGGEVLSLHSSVAITENTGWHSIVSSWDLNAGLGHMYIDDVESFSPAPTLTDGTLDYTRTEWAIGSDGGSNNGTFWAGCLGVIWFSTTLYLDLSIEANRRLFVNSTGGPVDLGSTGVVSSTTPIIFLNQAVPNYGNNLGSGGDFTGTLQTCVGPST